MKERPILFNASMVRAVLDGRKTQTRRVVQGLDDNNWLAGASNHIVHSVDHCPYGQPGDRLWVRETWGAHWMYDDVPPREIPDDGEALVHYPADGYVTQGAMGPDHFRKNRPSIHMPRWASRITLEITDVRAEKLQDISEYDVIAEGLTMLSKDYGRTFKFGIAESDGLPDESAWQWKEWEQSALDAFAKLWRSTGGNWDANPWVWVVTFNPINPEKDVEA